jgi:hypothetical protein
VVARSTSYTTALYTRKSNGGSSTISGDWSVIGQFIKLILDKEELVYECYESS